LGYIGLGSSSGVKAMLQSFLGETVDKFDEHKIIKIKNSWIDLEISPLDIVCLIISGISVVIYAVSKSWIFNNCIAIVFCVNAL